MAEKEVLSQTLNYLKLIGVMAQRQNTGFGFYENPDGTTRKVRYGEPGNLDIAGQLPDGRHLEIETKREGFNPDRPGNAVARTRWERQKARMAAINAQGGVAFWLDHPDTARQVMPLVLRGARIIERDDGRLEVDTSAMKPKEPRP